MYLTKEELIILQGLKNNQTFAEINKNLAKPIRTCDPKIDSLCQKYGVTDRVELVNKADLEKVSVGVTKTWKDRLNSFFQIVFRNGGRTGVGFQLGLNYTFDWLNPSKTKSTKATTGEKTIIKSLSMK